MLSLSNHHKGLFDPESGYAWAPLGKKSCGRGLFGSNKAAYVPAILKPYHPLIRAVDPHVVTVRATHGLYE